MSENSSQDERISSMALQRKAYDDFLKWKSAPDRRALLVTGARQVGKTYLIREFGRNEYEVFLEINFIETPKAREIFEGDLDADTLVANLTAFTKVPLVPGQTLVFFDETQECPRARTAMKFLVEDGRFDYIESGSLLGVSYKEVPVVPGGLRAASAHVPAHVERVLRRYGPKRSDAGAGAGTNAESRAHSDRYSRAATPGIFPVYGRRGHAGGRRTVQ